MRTIHPRHAHPIPSQAKRVFQGQIYDVYQWPQELYDGTEATFEMLDRPDTVQVLAIKDHQLVVIKEIQPSFTQEYYSLPCGRHDHDEESELEAIKRELLEETGMKFKNWKLVDVVQPVTKIDWLVYTYVATDFDSQQEPKVDAGEKITVELVDLPGVLKLAKSAKPGFFPKELLEKAKSVDDLADLPEFAG